MPRLKSRLPEIGTTIFTVVSRRARELNALNLGQGYPDYPIDPRLTELVTRAMEGGHTQYAPMEGLMSLRQRIAAKIARCYGVAADPEREITVTLGATEAIFSAILAVVQPGEEVIAFDPAYDSYEPAVRLAGGRCIRIPLTLPDFRYDWPRVAAAMSPRTRLVLFNSPHNPACTVASAEDLAQLAALAVRHDALVLSDEVYEHMVFDGGRHHSVLLHPGLRERSFAVFSFGKTLHATGMRIGYCVAPPELSAELRKVHQFNTFSISHPAQAAISDYLAERPQTGDELAGFFQAKRDRLRAALAGSGFGLPPAQGTYFQLLDYSAFAPADDLAFAERLLTEGGVASIPLSPFYERAPPLPFVRLCIAKSDALIDAAGERLRGFAARLQASS